MKKNFYLILALFTAATVAYATPRSLQQKLDIAAGVLHSGTSAKSANGSKAALKELKSADNLSVIGYENGGFVIVSNDDEARPVLGYSDGIFDETANPSLRWYVSAANEALANGNGNVMKVAAPAQFDGVKSYVAPLLTSTWNQGNPYNLLTPTYGNNQHFVTGCVATAMSQVMYFHKYPSVGQGSSSYNFVNSSGSGIVLSVDYSKETYDWSLMLDNYTGTESDSSKNEVAKLMFDTGVSCQMQYNEDGSGAYTYQAANALVNYFSYNPNLQLFTRSSYSEELWMQKVYKELDAGRPIMYAGSDARTNSGHEFVIDGYNADGYVHVNWGWGGYADGYFDIALLNPAGSQFSEWQEMVMGIATPDENIQAENLFTSSNGITYSPSTTTPNVMYLSLSATNEGRSRYLGPVAVVIADKDGNNGEPLRYFTTGTSRTGTATAVDYSFFHDNSQTLSIFTLRYGTWMANKPDGTYRLYIGTTADNVWWPIHAPEGKVNSILMEKSGDTYTLTSDTTDLWMAALSPTPSGIRSVSANGKSRHISDDIYNLSGQRVNGDYKGIYIRNGKKYVKGK